MQNIVCSDRPFTDMNGSVWDIGTEVSSSADAGEKCFAKGLFPATLRHIESSMISNSSTYWTSIIRMNSMIRTDETFYTDGPRLYAYIIKFDGHRLGVKFDDGRSNIRRKSLCETPTFVTTTATTKEGDTTSTLNFPETTEDTRTIPKATTTEGHPTSKIPETTETSSTKPKVDQRVPVVEISASVLALIGFGILIVIILRKRGWLRCFDDSKNENKESPVKFTNTDCTESQTRDGPKADQDQGYSVTEDMPTKNKTSGKGQMMCDYVDVNNMSVTKNIPRNIQHTANVHNNVNQGLEVYDHLKHFGMQDHDISQPIHDYDSTTATFSGNQDDTYNHLSMNESPNHRRNTDNVYGVQNKGELDQIYNQLNERPERKHTLENIYGLQDKNETEYDTTVETPVTCKDRSEKTTGVNYDKVNKNWFEEVFRNR
ncbi:uncharacterized protein LOC128203037 isoform X1 [Mya arenaria]|uniref:uncharacterized protein LOC128203037 isoform X1 n=1 Tax=Mya arenaria TaxID=6604 RepID=UPI0022DFC1D5|nr:uncharacterized protein LOC128203037 isoform X1 [Mya arenaria]